MVPPMLFMQKAPGSVFGIQHQMLGNTTARELPLPYTAHHHDNFDVAFHYSAPDFFILAQGRKKPKGYPCPPHSQPWQAAIYKYSRFYCGASLLNQRWVLTAAHCNHGSIHVRLGDDNLNVLEGTEQFLAVEKTIVHPKYNQSCYDNDVMLVKLLSPAVLNHYVQPISLATQRASSGDMCMVSGWGGPINFPERIPLVLYCANVRIMSWEECSALYPGKLNTDMMCAAAMGGGTDSCEGDSGGPLVCNRKLQGLVSWGDVPCSSSTKPGVYMDISRYRDWIIETMCDDG
uniref:trypsin-4-like isoform X1 n=1 Tax=Podarcis muralis TaxID=64176 RepID=UPI00109F2898|nr:trypsin-4-like isoform X1 [Podarcis muralis]